MRLGDIIGGKDAAQVLEGMIREGRVPHALMLYENDGCGAMAMALAFLGELFGSEHKVSGLIHPDVHYVYPVASGSKVNEKVDKLRADLFLGYWRDLMKENPFALETEVDDAFGIEGKQTAINNAEAREVLETVYLSPVEGGWKAVVVYLPEKMNPTAANKLLKMLEEPPALVQFVMITHAPEKLLPTISSRCQLFRVHGDSAPSVLRYDDSGLFPELMASLTARDLQTALDTGEKLAALPSRDNAVLFCRYASERLRRVFLLQQGLESLVPDAGDEERQWAGKCRKSFPRRALEALDRSALLIRRNVNMKIIFTDLVNKLYMNF